MSISIIFLSLNAILFSIYLHYTIRKILKQDILFLFVSTISLQNIKNQAITFFTKSHIIKAN